MASPQTAEGSAANRHNTQVIVAKTSSISFIAQPDSQAASIADIKYSMHMLCIWST